MQAVSRTERSQRPVAAAPLPFDSGMFAVSVGAMQSAPIFAAIYSASGLARAAKIQQGLSAKAIPALANDLSLTINDIARYLGLSPRTLRNRTRKLNADEAQRGFRAYRVLRRATEVLGDEASARNWMKTPQRALGEKKPLELIAVDVGAEEVLNVLGAIEEGSYL
jgi:putative toxin-antitoxin system antitoxin component (TIGR02293 family)